MTSQLDDERLCELFSAFDDAQAPEAAKARVIDTLFGDESEGCIDAGRDARSGSKSCPSSAARSKRRFGVVRFMAAAACVTALVVGGAAYALPASSVTVSVGDSSAEVGVNCFGVTVSATSADEGVQRALDDARVRNVAYDESIDRVIEALGVDGSKPVEVSVEGGDEQVRERLEARAAEAVGERVSDGAAAPAALPSPDGDDASDGPDARGQAAPDPSGPSAPAQARGDFEPAGQPGQQPAPAAELGSDSDSGAFAPEPGSGAFAPESEGGAAPDSPPDSPRQPKSDAE